MSNKVHTYVRLKPIKDKSKQLMWEIPSPTVLLSISDNKHYSFDKVFGMNCITQKIFNEAFMPIITKVIQGENLSVLAFGLKNSGKTFTISGTKVYPGILPLAIDFLFDYISSNTGEYLISCSYTELYRDTIFDLISGEVIEITSSKNQRKEICISAKQIKNIMNIGNTRKHENSHSIFTIVVESLGHKLSVSSLSFFDMASLDCLEAAKSTESIKAMILQNKPNWKIEKFIAPILNSHLVVLATISADSDNLYFTSLFRFMERLRCVDIQLQQVRSSFMLIELKQRLELLRNEIKENPDNECLVAEYESLESMIIISGDSSRMSFEESIAQESAIKNIEHVDIKLNNRVNENQHMFDFDIIKDPAVGLPHDEWLRLIIDQDSKIGNLRASLTSANNENFTLKGDLERLKLELNGLKYKIFSGL
ncbi:hypothetical protein SteCoe_32386 [Stentor coeruleus]|uniref:Kinesin motor domain-containing protein n=1 Tax=Stentor coeruleus TaxID=5963 RepID=A0A1R2AZ39_9CILI|nr:hypothetical protein SteCoe_32386 [Stentor coeruleus]